MGLLGGRVVEWEEACLAQAQQRMEEVDAVPEDQTSRYLSMMSVSADLKQERRREVTSPRRRRCFASRQQGVQQQQMRTRQTMRMTTPVTIPKKLITLPPPIGPWLNLVGAQHLRCQEGPQQFVKWSGSPGCGQLKAVSTSSEKMFEVLVIQHLCPLLLAKTPSRQSKAERRCPQMFWPTAILAMIRGPSGMSAP